MIRSIRKFLLFNLLIAIITTTVMMAVGNYYLDQKDIENHLDSLMREAAYSLKALLGNDFYNRNLQVVQASINSASTETLTVNNEGVYDPRTAQKYQFQVWDESNHLLLRSLKAPNQPLSDINDGFSDKKLGDHSWRSYATFDKDLGIKFIIGEEDDSRSVLSHTIAQDDLYIMMLTYPLVGLLIWVILGRGLRSIDRVASEVSHRLPNYLEPVDPTDAPLEIKPLVVELNKLFIRLQQALEREKRFAGDAAHELRTPLAALKTQAQVALRSQNQDERLSILQHVITGVDRCTHVVQQLLTLSRLVPEANVLYDAMPVNLSKLASEMVAQLVPIALDKKIEIELIAPDGASIVFGNITALSILIRNLVDNAIRYTPEGGNIEVHIEHVNDRILLKVIDNGPGIPAELRARVFERFFRVLGTKSPGSGLGLAIVQQIAQLHNAQVKLGAPATGKGLEVEISFPRHQD